MDTHDIPYFVQVRGCVNCDVSKSIKEKTGDDYGFDHEIVAGCIIRGCEYYGFGIAHPFIDPEDVIKEFIKNRESYGPEELSNLKTYISIIESDFGADFNSIGVSLDTLIERLT